MPQDTISKRSKYRAKSTQEIRHYARDLRKQLEIDDRYAPDLYEILHRLHKVIPNFRLKEIRDEDLPMAEGKAHPELGILEIPKSTLVALDKYGDARSRWTTAHEVGHIVLGHPGRLYRKRPHEQISPQDELYENEADTFASEFLAPTHLASEFSQTDDISRRFQLSTDAAARRVEELEKYRDEEQHRIADEKRLRNVEARRAQLPTVVPQTETIPRAFAAMAYTDKTDRLYIEILKPAVEEAGLICLRADEMYSVDAIAHDIQRAISEAHIVLAEISGFNPNVMHEIGLAQSLRKPTILLCEDSYREYEIPSNIRHIRRIMYRNDVGSGPQLKRRLLDTLRTLASCFS